MRGIDLAQVERYGNLRCGEPLRVGRIRRGDLHRIGGDGPRSLYEELEGLRTVVSVEHRRLELEGLREVVAGPLDARSLDERLLRIERLPEALRSVDRDLVILHETLDDDVERNAALVAVGDHQRELAPLSGADVLDLLAELHGLLRVGKGSLELHLEGVLLGRRREVARTALRLGKDEALHVERDGGLRIVGKIFGEVRRDHHRNLDVGQRTDDLADLRGLALADRNALRTAVVGVLEGGGRIGGALVRTYLHLVDAGKKLQPREGLQFGEGAVELFGVADAGDADQEGLGVDIRTGRCGAGSVWIGLHVAVRNDLHDE